MDLVNALSTLDQIGASRAVGESDVESCFSKPFLHSLGFDDSEIVSQFPVGRKVVDWAARKNIDGDAFFQSRKLPSFYMEVKGRTESFEEHSPSYIKHAKQLRQYLMSSSSGSVQWGVLMNSVHAQLFRKHGKLVHTVSPCIPFGDDGSKVVQAFKKLMQEPRRAINIAVYNNKGGVGKTTTTINLAGTLSSAGKAVLVVDLDPNQGDLGDSLNIPKAEDGLRTLLTQPSEEVAKGAICGYKFQHPRSKRVHEFNVLPADPSLSDGTMDVVTLRQFAKPHSLLKALSYLQHDYDYILIDAPPGLATFPKMALCAADVVLVPVRHDNRHSLQNAGDMIAQVLPKIRKQLQQRMGIPGPSALPVFLNNFHSLTESQIEIMHRMISKIISSNKDTGVDLTPYFYPRRKPRKGSTETSMISVPYLSYISQSDFIHVPGVFWHKTIKDHYENLAKEFFLAS